MTHTVEFCHLPATDTAPAITTCSVRNVPGVIPRATALGRRVFVSFGYASHEGFAITLPSESIALSYAAAIVRRIATELYR